MVNVPFRIQDAIDILIMAFVVYRLISLIKGTPAAPLAAGAGIVAAALAAAYALGLPTLSWFFEHLRPMWVVVVAVIFAPEIRKALGQIGSNRLVRAVLMRRESTVDAVVAAAFEFSVKHVGALVVFERNVPLGSYVERGVRLNSEISRELLGAIFEEQSPLHDGAVIIIGDRVAAAAVMLPLTENPEVSKTAGARHRAALGISEATDAVVVVVSEETGQVSLAAEGKLTPVGSGPNLKAALEDYLKGRL